MRLADFDYSLPSELIAQYPLAERTGSRLMHLSGTTGTVEDRLFAELPTLLGANDLLVFNDTKVIKARLFGAKQSGGRVEILIERVVGARQALAQIRASHAPRPGSSIMLGGDVGVQVIDRQGELFRLDFGEGADVLSILAAHGMVPLPPYITHAADAEDASRYQTVYARTPGAVAAPTAGLHFDSAMLTALRAAGVGSAFVTLHVGAGTFQPVRVDDLSEHKMHSEYYEIPAATVDAIVRAKANGGRIVAVGTTSLRAMESAARRGKLSAGSGETNLFITPGYRFAVVDRLLTNFHLPKSTLLMLVSAFAGVANIRDAYAHAIAQRYRFFSYGDAMLIERRQPAEQQRE